MSRSGVTVNLWRTPVELYRLASRVGDLRPVFREFHAYHSREIDSVFRKLGRNGGYYRGLIWRPWSPASIGRTRPSGRKVTMMSQLLQDTGRLRQDAATGVLVVGRTSLMYGPSVSYAEKQYEKRNVYSVTREDEAKLLELIKKALVGGNQR